MQDGAIWLPCDLRLVLGNRATDQNCARHIISDVTALISLGGLADGRLSEALDAALDESHRRQSRSEAAAVFQHGESGWGWEGWTKSPTVKPALLLSVIFSDSLSSYLVFRKGFGPWALASFLTGAVTTRGVIGHPAPKLTGSSTCSLWTTVKDLFIR